MTPNYFRWVKTATAAPENPWPTSLNTGWVSHYNFNTSSYVNTGTGAISDAHGSINGTTAAGTPSYSTVSGTLHAAGFGSADRIEFGDSHEYSGSCSFSFWIKNTAASSGNYGRVFGTYSSVSGRGGSRLFEYNAGSDTQLRMQTNDGGNQWRSGGTLLTLSNLNQWYHVIIVCDESVATENQQIKGYVYGTLNGTDNLASSSGMATGQSSNTNAFGIGRGTWTSAYWTGQIADLRIWDRALTSSEVEALWDYEKEEQKLIVNAIDGDGDGVGAYDDIDDTNANFGDPQENTVWFGYRDTTRNDRDYYENITMQDASDGSQVFSVNPWYNSNLYFPGGSMKIPAGTVNKTYHLSASVSDSYDYGQMDLFYFSGSATDLINNVRGQNESTGTTAGAVRLWRNPAKGDKWVAIFKIDSSGNISTAVDIDSDGVFTGSAVTTQDISDSNTIWGEDFNGVFIGYSTDASNGAHWDALAIHSASNDAEVWSIDPAFITNDGTNMYVYWHPAYSLPRNVSNATYYISSSFSNNDRFQNLYWYSGSAKYVYDNLHWKSAATNRTLANKIFEWGHNTNPLISHQGSPASGYIYEFKIAADGTVTTAQDFDGDGVFTGSSRPTNSDVHDNDTTLGADRDGFFFGWQNNSWSGQGWSNITLDYEDGTEVFSITNPSQTGGNYNANTANVKWTGYSLPEGVSSSTFYLTCSFNSNTNGADRGIWFYSGSLSDLSDYYLTYSEATAISGVTKLFNRTSSGNDLVLGKFVVDASGNVTAYEDEDQDDSWTEV